MPVRVGRAQLRPEPGGKARKFWGPPRKFFVKRARLASGRWGAAVVQRVLTKPVCAPLASPRRTGELAVTGFRRRRAGPQRNLAAATLSSNFRARLKIGASRTGHTALEIARLAARFESFFRNSGSNDSNIFARIFHKVFRTTSKFFQVCKTFCIRA